MILVPRSFLVLSLSIILFSSSSHGQPYALLIAKDNKIIKTDYYDHYTADSLFNDQSLTKSIVSLLIGIAIDQHFIRSVDEKIIDFFPELKTDSDSRKKEITLRQVMNQASGLYHENLQRMDLYLNNPDPAGLVLHSPLVADPGKEWHYNNAATHLLSVILTKATHLDTKTFAEKFVFTPMGITHFEWAKMRDGYYDGCGLLSIRLRIPDLLKIGQMLLDGGQYDHRPIVPAEWIRLILQPDISYPSGWGFDHSTYALCWYHMNYKGVDITYGMGWGGQFLVLIPSLRSVVVINENIADATAIRQSNNFIYHLFPPIFDQITKK